MKSEIKITMSIYDSPVLEPKISTYIFHSVEDFMQESPKVVFENIRAKNSPLPFEVVKEVVQNLIHSDFTDCLISILDEGKTVRVADRGKGIKDKEKVLLAGFTSSTSETAKFIRGAGAGLYLMKENLKMLGGTLTIEDNIEGGTVVTISTAGTPDKKEVVSTDEDTYLTDRQKKILLCFSDVGKAGPSQISREIDIPIATAYRDIILLEKKGLIIFVSSGKRHLTQKGIRYLQR